MRRQSVIGGVLAVMALVLGACSGGGAKKFPITVQIDDRLRDFEVSVDLVGVADDGVAYFSDDGTRRKYFDRENTSERDNQPGRWTFEYRPGEETTRMLPATDPIWNTWLPRRKGGAISKIAVLARIGNNGFPAPVFIPVTGEEATGEPEWIQVTPERLIRRPGQN